tara:strand:+ start:1433 stop:2395 length:963 start_codon:yes stop_codon:yes gene_type:complete
MSKKICVVGGGYWGKNHIKTLNDMGCLFSIVEKDNELLDYYKQQYSNVKLFSSLEDSLQSNFVDGYVVATPAETHFDIAKKIIINNKSVLVEKPFVLNMDDAVELKRLSIHHNVNVMVGHVMLFHPAITKIKEILDSGEIGELRYIYSNRLNFGIVKNKENVFWSLSTHDIALFQYFSGSKIKSFDINGKAMLQNNIHDSVVAYFEYENGIHSHIFSSWLHPFKEHKMVFIGEEGMISFHDSDDPKTLKLYLKKMDLQNNKIEKIEKIEKNISFLNDQPLKRELEYFVDCINKKEINVSNIDQAIEVTKILIKSNEILGL